jgi:hypothetical protein
MSKMIEYKQRIGKHEHGFRNSNRISTREWHSWLEIADTFIAKIADRASQKSRQPVHRNRPETVQLGLYSYQRIYRPILLALARAKDSIGIRAQEAKPRYTLSSLNTFQKKGMAPLRYLQVG